MEVSGIEEIILNSEICSNGSLSRVMSRKHYNRCKFVLKTIYEALQRLIFEKYEDTCGQIPKETISRL